MKRVSIIFLFLCFISKSKAQRYLTNQFTQVDSIVNISYGSAPDYLGATQTLLLDFFQPNGDLLTKRPLIIYVHGGGFTSGTRKYLHIKNILSRMVLKGYVAASIDYRLDPNFNLYNSTTDRRAMTDAMHDANAAIRFFKANASTYGIDTNQIIIGGESAGAITSMMSAYVNKQSEMVIYPMANPNNPDGNSGNAGHSNKTKATLCLCGLILDTAAIEINDNPLLIVHGTSDTYIPIVFPQMIVSRAQHSNTNHSSYFFNGATHCPWITTLPNYSLYEDSTVTLITNFLYPQIITSVKENKDLKNETNIYPNPSTNSFYIDNSAIAESVNIIITSIVGQQVYKTTINPNEKVYIELEHASKGVYFITLENNNYRQTKKIIIK